MEVISTVNLPEEVVLSSTLANSPAAVLYLKLLGFSFEPRGLTQHLCEPSVKFPSWDPDSLIERAKKSVSALKRR